MRIYDGRLGRFLSVDPITKEYPELTPYQFASNRPIDGIDQDGLEYISPDLTNVSLRFAKQTWNKIAVFCNERHAQGMLNRSQAEAARQMAIKQGRTNGDGITGWTKAMVYIGSWWYGGKINNVVNPVQIAKDAKEDFQEGHYILGSIGVISIIPGFSELKSLNYAGEFGKCSQFAAEFTSKFGKSLAKVGAKVETFEINIGKGGLIGTATQQLSDNGMHRFVEVTKEGKTLVFDNLHPEGVLKSDYTKALAGVTKTGKHVSGESLIKDAKKITK